MNKRPLLNRTRRLIAMSCTVFAALALAVSGCSQNCCSTCCGADGKPCCAEKKCAADCKGPCCKKA